MIQELSRKNLEALILAFETISSSLDSQEILNRVMEQACGLLNAEAASIFLVDEKSNTINLKVATNLTEAQIKKIKVPIGSGLVGFVAQTGEIVNILDAQNDSRFYSKVDSETGFVTKSCLTVPLIIDDKVTGVLQVLNKKNEPSFVHEDEILLKEFSRLVAVTLDKAFLHAEVVEKKKMEFDLKLATTIQDKLLPFEELHTGNFSFRGFYKPAKFVSGDYFDYYKYSDDEVFFTIGDVSGKGSQASLIMATAKAYLSASLESNTPFIDMINNFNRFLSLNTPEDKFITMFLGLMDVKSGIVKYVNAGHEPPIIIRRSGQLEEISSTGLMMGIVENWNYNVESFQLGKNDSLFIYTDGVTEASDMNSNQFGLERLKDILKRETSKPTKIFQTLPENLSAFTGQAEQFDDITFLVIHHKT
ncbi:MAG: SpoIIE family protein phosphatase [Bacteroidetes bacterium]|nr:SpoIIE family protein phosphatase [Bacteroidota bacterium]